MGDITHRFPWETQPPAAPTTEDTVRMLQRDVAFIVKYTAVHVRSNVDALDMLVNTPRGQIVPQGICMLSDGSTFEFHDIGAPQPGAPVLTIKELVAQVWDVVGALGLELQT